MNSNSDFVWDVCVIGKGLLGSAAARHLSEMGLKVLLLGPDAVSYTHLPLPTKRIV